MNQIFWNDPPRGYAMTAEEFAAETRPSGCGGCGSTPVSSGCDCGCAPAPGCPGDGCGQGGCCQPMICCCRPAPEPVPQPPQVEEGCCCKQSFRAALGLLCDQRISSLIDFDAAAFLTGAYAAGAAVQCGQSSGGAAGGGDDAGGDAGDAAAQADDDAGTTDKPKPPTPCPCTSSDNLGELSGSFRRFALCSCDLLDIDAELYNASGCCCEFDAQQVSMCELDAVVIQGAAACAEGDLTADEVANRNFRCLRTLLAQRLNPCGNPCGPDCCSCACDSRDCCCAAGLLSTLAQNNLSRRVSLTAGLLILQNVMLLGTVGNVLVLANEASNRLYFVCVNSVQFIG